jgi:hypothetical protein
LIVTAILAGFLRSDLRQEKKTKAPAKRNPALLDDEIMKFRRHGNELSAA